MISRQNPDPIPADHFWTPGGGLRGLYDCVRWSLPLGVFGRVVAVLVTLGPQSADESSLVNRLVFWRMSSLREESAAIPYTVMLMVLSTFPVFASLRCHSVKGVFLLETPMKCFRALGKAMDSVCGGYLRCTRTVTRAVAATVGKNTLRIIFQQLINQLLYLLPGFLLIGFARLLIVTVDLLAHYSYSQDRSSNSYKDALSTGFGIGSLLWALSTLYTALMEYNLEYSRGFPHITAALQTRKGPGSTREAVDGRLAWLCILYGSLTWVAWVLYLTWAIVAGAQEEAHKTEPRSTASAVLKSLPFLSELAAPGGSQVVAFLGRHLDFGFLHQAKETVVSLFYNLESMLNFHYGSHQQCVQVVERMLKARMVLCLTA